MKLKIGTEYTKEEIENILIKPRIDKSIGRIRGIVPIYLDKEEKEKNYNLIFGCYRVIWRSKAWKYSNLHWRTETRTSSTN